MKSYKDKMKRFAIALAVLVMAMLVPLAHAAADEDTMQGQGSVSNIPPTCEITQPADGSTHTAGTSISFAATAQDNNNDNLTYWWNFGDGSDNVYGASATHSYSAAGTYTVTLTVSDNYENVSDNISVTVTSAPEQGTSPGPSPRPSYPPADIAPPTLAVLSPTATEAGRHLTVRVSAYDASGVDPSSIAVKLDNNPVGFTFSNEVIVVALSDLEPGDHVLQVSAADLKGNSGGRTISFTVSPKVVTVRLGVVTAGENASADFSTSGTPVRGVTLLPLQSLENVCVNVRVLDEKPELPAPPGIVFAHLEISTDASTGGAVIEFAVPRAWCEGNGVDGDTIRMYRYSNPNWQELPTARISENATHWFYSATAQGFSMFAIVGQPSSQVPGQSGGIPAIPLVALVLVACAGIISSLFATGRLKLSSAPRGARRPRRGGGPGRVTPRKILIFAAFVLVMLAVLFMLPLVGAEGQDSQDVPGQLTIQNAPPTVTITSPTQGAQLKTDVSVGFQADASDPNGTQVTYSWDFGDGWTSSEASPTHSYSSAGSYVVQLTVSDGELTASDSVGITVTAPGAEPTETVPPTLTVLAPLETEVQKDVVVRVSATDDNSGIDSNSIIAKLDGLSITHTFSDGVITINLTDLTLGDHQVQVWVADVAGNWADVTVSFTVVPPPPVTVQLSGLVAGEDVTADFSASGTPVYEVVLVPAASRASASVSLRTLAERPPELPYPPGVVFAYLELSTDASIDNAAIEFTVPRSWLIQNSVGENTIKLYRYSDNNWQEMPTAGVENGDNATYKFYSAVSPSLSTFAITGQAVSPVRFMTFTLSLPSDPVTGAQASITVRAENPTSLALSRQFELRLGSAYVVPLTIEVSAGQMRDIPLTLNVAGLEGTYDVVLFDSEENRTLASGQMVFGGYVPPEEERPAEPFPILPLVVGLAIAVPLVAVGVLSALGKVRLQRPPWLGGRRVKQPSWKKPKPSKGRGKGLVEEESPVIQRYHEILSPAAHELAAKKKVRHLKRAVKPYKKRRKG